MADLEKRFGFFNNCLFIKEAGICAASDLHIGLEDELHYQGLIFPLMEEEMLLERLKAVLERFRPSVFVLAGDVFHSFDRMEWKSRETFNSVLRMLEEQCQVVLLKGSHDTMLSKFGKEILDRYEYGDFTFAHGHAALNDHRMLIMGHEHPVIQIEMERLPCFLYGEKVAQGRDLILLPAFNPLCQGVIINQVEGRDLMSPVLKGTDMGEFYPVVEVQGEVLTFPKLRMLRQYID
jgi:putative SbcD/Mre11-related phosphoesterase